MASTTIVTTVCDLPHDNETTAVKTVRFSLGGRTWDIDVCGPHGQELAGTLWRFAECARPARRPQQVQRRRPAHTKANEAAARERRDWMRAHGIKVATKGKLPKAAVAAYDAAHGISR